jgi:hypothetical protein
VLGILRFLTTFDADDRFLAMRTPRLGGSLGDPIGDVFVMLITNRKDSGKRDDGLTAVGSFLQRDEWWWRWCAKVVAHWAAEAQENHIHDVHVGL